MGLKTIAYQRNAEGKPTSLLDVASLEPSVYEGLKKQAEAQAKADSEAEEAERAEAEKKTKEANSEALKNEYYSVHRFCAACDSLILDWLSEALSEEKTKDEAVEAKEKALGGSDIEGLLSSSLAVKERFLALFGEEPAND